MRVFRAAVLTAALALGAASSAQATFLATLDGNDCAGEFGIPFGACKIPTTYDPNQSPVIIKFDYNDTTGQFDAPLINALFPTIDGSEFFFDLGAQSFVYTPDDPEDPLITFYVAKGGNLFNLFSADDTIAPQEGTWYPPDGTGLSHLTFYDTGAIPEPAVLALFGLGLALVASRLRRR